MSKRLFRPALLLLVVLMALTAACAAPGVPGQDRNFRTINVNGSGMVFGSPDIATADIGVTTRNVNVQAASDENTRQMQAVLAALKNLGVADEDIRTSQYSIVFEQTTNPDGTISETREYVITNIATVTFRDLSKVGEGLGAAIEAGANSVANIVFGVEDTSSLSAEARKKALTDAQARAQQLAEAAGVTLDGPYNISESYSYIPQLRSLDLAGATAEQAAGAPVPVQTGQISVQVDVNVTYLIK